MNRTPRKYILGRCLLTPVTCDQELLSVFDRLLKRFPNANGDTSAGNSIPGWFEFSIDIDHLLDQGFLGDRNDLAQTGSDALVALLGKAMSEHTACVWLDAATLVLPSSRLAMLAGPSLAGKTTLALAMHLAYCWQALSEDVTLIDAASRSVIPVARPSSLRADCAGRIERAAGRALEPLILDQWFFDGRMFVEEPIRARFDLALMLEPVPEAVNQPVVLEAVSPAEYIRLLLPISNALRMPSALEILEEALDSAQCFHLRGGSLEDRMQALLRLSKEGPRKEGS